MFGFLKKKIEEFTSKVASRAEEKLEEPAPSPQPTAAEPPPPEPLAAAEPVPTEEPIAAPPQPEPEAPPIPEPAPLAPAEELPPEPEAPVPAEPEPEPVPPVQEAPEPPAPAESPLPAAPEAAPPRPPRPTTAKPKLLSSLLGRLKKPKAPTPPAAIEPEPAPAEPARVYEPTPAPALPETAEASPSKPAPPKERLSLLTKLKRAVAAEVRLSDSEIGGFLEDFELALLEADVAQPVAEGLIAGIRARLAGKSFSKKDDIRGEIEKAVRASIMESIDLPGFTFQEKVRGGVKPFVIMFLGPNGAGKTTTLAKVAHMLKRDGMTSIFAASDTFRAASMEQLQHHADALGIRMVKHTYGSDPAAVAFDAIKSAEANGADCVLIDTAGRQETNRNLMEELKKIKRVAKPQLIIYLDEAIAGNVLAERVAQFKEAIGVDGVILSKMDMDAKGGGTISIAHSTGVPVVYYGTGQAYGDLVPFDARSFLDKVFG